MDPTEYQLINQVEMSHWWYRGMRRIMQKLFDTYIRTTGHEFLILDAGCGTGAGMIQFSNFGRVFGMDLSLQAISFCKEKELMDLTLASVTSIPYKSDFFDIVMCMDVLYENSVMSDQQAISEFKRITRSGGYLLLRLPAFQWLSGAHDQMVHTRKRYNRAEVNHLLLTAGYDVLFSGYANTFLFPFIFLKRLFDRQIHPHQSRSDLNVHLPWFEQFFYFLLTLEAALIPTVSFPFGSSVIAIAQLRKTAHE